jgi:hypothetical protein
VDTLRPLLAGTKVRIKISYRSENFDALGKVVYALQNAGMGILFTKIEPNVVSRKIAIICMVIPRSSSSIAPGNARKECGTAGSCEARAGTFPG